MGDLFAFTVLENGQIRIPKAALPGLDNPTNITAAQFFASVILRGKELYPQQLSPESSAVSTGQAHYPDFGTGKIIRLSRTEITILSN